jgi:hypothetical protein
MSSAMNPDQCPAQQVCLMWYFQPPKLRINFILCKLSNFRYFVETTENKLIQIQNFSTQNIFSSDLREIKVIIIIRHQNQLEHYEYS